MIAPNSKWVVASAAMRAILRTDAVAPARLVTMDQIA